MPIVVKSDMVAHLWASQSQSEARTSTNTISFTDTTLYSYRMEIARIIRRGDGENRINVVLFNCRARNRSHTTSQHLSNAKSAARHFVHQYTVPHIYPNSDEKHKENIEFLATQYKIAVDTLLRTKNPDYWNTSGRKALEIKLGEINGYCMIFCRETPAIDLEADCAKIDARFIRLAALASDPKRVAAKARRDAKKAAERAEQERLEALAVAEKIKAWQAGANVRLPWSGLKTPQGGVYLRVVKDKLETSMGAEVPLDDAIAIFKMVDKLIRTIRIVTVYHINSRCGHFTVDCVYPNGNIKAGCHLIEWTEAQRIARQLGLPVGLATLDATEVNHVQI